MHFLKIGLTVLLTGWVALASAQTLPLTTIATLDGSISETSGLELSAGGGYWTHNDSGNDPELYHLDGAGTITRTLRISNATNVDWEDLARDNTGRMYIGDFGNNANNRSNLRIYRIPDPDGIVADSTTAEIMDFDYPDQTAFPPPVAQQNFDMEAMIHFGGSLYLFSKNRTDPFTGFTRIYRLPTAPGTYTAQLIDSFYTGAGPATSDWITAADVSPDGQTLVLLGYEGIWVFSCRNGRSFLDGIITALDFPGILPTQKEGIVFTSNTTIAITDEELSPFFSPQLYTADLGPWIAADCCPAPENLTSSWSGTNLTLHWDAVPGADGYRARLLAIGGAGAQQVTGSTNATFASLDTAFDYLAAVQVKCGNEISDLSDTLFVSGGSLKMNRADQVTLYPNPAVHWTTLSLNRQAQIAIADLQGKTWFTETLIPGQHNLDLEPLPPGTYFLQIRTPKGLSTQPLMKVDPGR